MQVIGVDLGGTKIAVATLRDQVPRRLDDRADAAREP